MSVWKKYITMIRQDIKDAMSKRNGLDELNNLLMLLGFIFVVVALFSKKWIFTLIGAAFIILCYIRVFSKKVDSRKKENTVYMKYMGNVVRKTAYFKECIKMWIRSMKDKEYVYFICKHCGQIIRVPKGKNKVSVRCPKCSQTFIKRT